MLAPLAQLDPPVQPDLPALQGRAQQVLPVLPDLLDPQALRVRREQGRPVPQVLWVQRGRQVPRVLQVLEQPVLQAQQA